MFLSYVLLYIVVDYRDFNTSDSVPVLQHVIAHGNTTSYEYRHGQAPDSVEEVQLNFSVEDEDAMDDSKAGEVYIDIGVFF